MDNTIIFEFVSSFLALFGANIAKYEIYENKVLGIIDWKEEGEEEYFLWVMDIDMSILYDMKLLCDYLLKNSLISIDTITISEVELIKKLSDIGWNDIYAQQNINYLCSIHIERGNTLEEVENKKVDVFCINFENNNS